MTVKLNELKASRAAKVESLVTLSDKMAGADYVDDAVDNEAFAEIEKEVEALDATIKRVEGVQALKASLAKPVTTHATVPARAKRHMKLKAYKGEHAEENAYRVGQWLKSSIFGDIEARDWCRDNGVGTVNKALSEGINSAGGFLVPTEMMDSIIDLREDFGVFRKYAKIVPMTSDTLDWPRRVGGLTAYFVGENVAATESNASWDNVSLVAKKLAVLTRISNELSEDAVVSIADLMTSEIAYAFASKEDDCGFNGDGTSTYGGIRGLTNLLVDANFAGSKVAAVSGHDLFSEIDATDITSLMGKLPAYATPNAKFFISQLGFATVFERLVASAGGNSISTLDGAIQYRYLGFPIVISQKLPAVTTAQNGTVMMLFGDLALASAMGERRMATIKRSDERYFEQDQIGILGTERVDIVNHDVGDATNAGPIVGLVGTT